MNIVILTGAGISQESGIATFRDADGLWNKMRVEDVATPEAFARDPALVHGFYNARRAQLPSVMPNAAHLALADLDARWQGGLLLVTQNVDDLHARAGSRRMVAMHGALRRARCQACDAVQDWDADLSTATPCPACGAVGGMRPHIVWFGEMPMGMDQIETALAACDLFVSIGTSGNVYPAAGFVAGVRGRARTLELNLERSAGTRLFDEARHGPATSLVPAWVAEVLAG
ncbi:NAD-dependent deacylase [Humitalea sp. 24SJ18S-53]|uniref:NAD-dependent deacylase n=1 Tax=Humitalea sp. 24SJ18S-53 TaxID=3422307 RepID=UPI003D66F186